MGLSRQCPCWTPPTNRRNASATLMRWYAPSKSTLRAPAHSPHPGRGRPRECVHLAGLPLADSWFGSGTGDRSGYPGLWSRRILTVALPRPDRAGGFARCREPTGLTGDQRGWRGLPPPPPPPPPPPSPPPVPVPVPVQVEIVMFTAVPSCTWAPPVGFWLCTVPGSRQLLIWDTEPTVRPAAVIWFRAVVRGPWSARSVLSPSRGTRSG